MVLGCKGVGKSSIIFQYVEKIFIEIDNEYNTEEKIVVDGKEVIIEIIDSKEIERVKNNK